MLPRGTPHNNGIGPLRELVARALSSTSLQIGAKPAYQPVVKTATP